MANHSLAAALKLASSTPAEPGTLLKGLFFFSQRTTSRNILFFSHQPDNCGCSCTGGNAILSDNVSVLFQVLCSHDLNNKRENSVHPFAVHITALKVIFTIFIHSLFNWSADNVKSYYRSTVEALEVTRLADDCSSHRPDQVCKFHSFDEYVLYVKHSIQYLRDSDRQFL